MLTTMNARVYVCTEHQDMRKSFDGLYGLAKHVLEEDPLSGALFVFFNRRRTQLKVLYYERGGLCLWAKRLERGTFELLSSVDGTRKRAITQSELLLLSEGVNLSSVERRVRHELQEGPAEVRENL